MNSIYGALNDAQVNPEDYSAEPLSAFEKKTMKREFRRRSGISRRAKSVRWTAVAACLVCLICFSHTAYAQAAINNFLHQVIFLGHSTAILQLNPDAEKDSDQFSSGYDKYGKPLTGAKHGPTDIYDAQGKKTGTTGISMDDVGMIEETNLSKAASQLSFRPLLPKTLPAGYAFEKSAIYREDDGSLTYINLHYTNGSSRIAMQELKVDVKSVLGFGTADTIEKTTVNGHAAAISGGHEIEWEADGISISIVAKDLSTDQLMKLAESMK
jgi:hypothetical protein